MILVAHQDDETIGASVAMGRMREATVVFLTDGAPHDARFWSPDAKGSRGEYAAMRAREAQAALKVAGIAERQIFGLGAVDQDAIERAPELVEKLARIVRQTQPDVIITHPYEGGHPDHDAAALIAYLASHSPGTGANSEILEMASYHAVAGKCVTGEFLPGGPAELTLWLSAEERIRKERMAACHHSQRFVLEGFSLDPERLRPAPRYDFTRPPHEGKLWYECLRWAMTGDRWRQLAASALAHFEQDA
jgi:LmbE family N-acetylglucosaminyl deacetylase